MGKSTEWNRLDWVLEFLGSCPFESTYWEYIGGLRHTYIHTLYTTHASNINVMIPTSGPGLLNIVRI